MKKILLAVSAFLIAQVASADILKLEAGSNTIDNVTISKSGTAKIESRSYALTTVGAGERTKKVSILNVKVYIAQILVSDTSKYVRSMNGALNSMEAQPAAAIQLNFLRAVEAGTVQTSFQEALAANNIDTDSGPVKAFLDAVAAGGDASAGKSISIVTEKLPNGIESVTYEDTNGRSETIQGKTGLIKDIFSIWLGTPADSGLTKLKNALLSGR